MEIERRILIADSADGQLQKLAMDLVGSNFEVHYASDLDEAQLLARESDGIISAVLFTAGDTIERIPSLAARFRVKPDQLIPCGDRPANRVVAALAHHGVRWHLWDNPRDEGIRFVISGVMHEHDPFELRYHLRVPINLPAHYVAGDTKCETQIQDLGRGGACLVGGRFGENGEQGELVFSFEGQDVSLPTRVAWAAPDENEALAIAGLSFQEVDPEAGQILDSLLDEVISRHRIEIRKPI